MSSDTNEKAAADLEKSIASTQEETQTEADPAPRPASVPTPPTSAASLYVGDLHPDVTEAALYEKFSPLGTINSARICRDAVSRRSLCYGYVNYQQQEHAKNAMATLNFEPLFGKPMRIMWSQRDPSARHSSSGNIFIQNLSPHIDSKAIYDTFLMFGPILSCKVALDADGNSKGYGYIHFEREDSALLAIEKVNGMELDGNKIYVGRFIARHHESGGSDSFKQVFVDNLPDDTTMETLSKLFGRNGEVTHTYVKSRGKGKGAFAFITFKEHGEAMKALDTMDGTELGGQKLRVSRVVKKDEMLNSSANLYVKNLNISIDDRFLKRVFEEFGVVRSVKVMLDDSGISRGFGFVSFERANDAERAMQQMQGKLIDGRQVFIAYAQKKEERKEELARQRTSGQLPPTSGNRLAPLFSSSNSSYFAAAAAASQQMQQRMSQQQQQMMRLYQSQMAPYSAQPMSAALPYPVMNSSMPYYRGVAPHVYPMNARR